jgi:DeoR/GlpR family transcriptional regulator of sugar metabolism
MTRRNGGVGPNERQQRIAELAVGRGRLRVSELVDLFLVTDETIRRDLDVLARAGVLRRTHGGAVATLARHEADFDRRLLQQEREKVAIGRAALEYVSDGSTIVLDSGTTCLQLARTLAVRNDLLVVTNALSNAVELRQATSVSVLMTGGMIRPHTLDAVGDIAVQTLRDLHVDQTFLSISDVSVTGGLTYPRLEEVSVKRAMIEAGSEVTLLADSTKFDHDALMRVAPITALTRIITSPGVDPDTAREIQLLGIELVIADGDGRLD